MSSTPHKLHANSEARSGICYCTSPASYAYAQEAACQRHEDLLYSRRNIRRDCMKAVDKLKDASEDEQKALEDAVQELTDDYVKQVDQLVKSKQDELTTV